jgi:hypothetical protein
MRKSGLDSIKQKEHTQRMPEEASEKPWAKNSDEVALDLMKFIAVTTGYGRGTPSAGFGGKGSRSSEEYADALLELFERCRAAVTKPSKPGK